LAERREFSPGGRGIGPCVRGKPGRYPGDNDETTRHLSGRSGRVLAFGLAFVISASRMTTRECAAGKPEFQRQIFVKIGFDNFDKHVNITNEMTEEHQQPTDATDIGLKLVGHSKSTEFTANRGLVIELFPFIFEASQRMSARAISRFLMDEQGVKLSAVTITKALNDPKKSWNSFFDIVEPSALVIAKWWRCETLNFLFTGRAKYEDNIRPAIGNLVGRLAVKVLIKGDVLSADKILRQKWFCINKLTLEKAKPYLEARLVVWVKPKEKTK
jgi:hypothetical protein